MKVNGHFFNRKEKLPLRRNKRESELRRRRKQPGYELSKSELVMSRLSEMLFELSEHKNRLRGNGERKKQRRLERRVKWRLHLSRHALSKCSRKNTSWQSRLSESEQSLREFWGIYCILVSIRLIYDFVEFQTLKLIWLYCYQNISWTCICLLLLCGCVCQNV